MTAPDTARLRAAFDADEPLTVGLEEELMLLDPVGLDLLPEADRLLARLAGDARFKPELPSAQVELITEPAATVGQTAHQALAARGDLATAADRWARLAAAGTHPFAAAEGPLNPAEVYGHTRDEYGPVARRQLVFGLHVHVRLAGAARAVAVFNAIRSYLPELAALAANAPFHAGRDSEFASARPGIARGLPRQGVPPPVSGLDQLATELRWGARAGVLPDPRRWWWDLRLHPVLGTIEVRVPDQQTTVGETAAVAAVVHSLVGWLAARHDAGEPLAVHPSWRIAENGWSAARHGLAGQLADLDSGERRPARERLADLMEELEPPARQLGCAAELASARRLALENGAERQRKVTAAHGLDGLASWLADRFLTPL